MSTSIVVIGCGDRFQNRHLPELIATPAIQVVGLYDPDPRALKKASDILIQFQKTPPTIRESWEKLLVDPVPDAALIVSPNKHHFSQVSLCLEHGIDVVVEKPPTLTLDEAHRLKTVLVKSDATLLTAFQGGLSKSRRMAVEVVQERLGTPILMLARVTDSWKVQHSKTWRQRPEMAGGGFVFDSGIHLLETVLDLGGPLSHVSALFREDREVELSATVSGQFENGCLLSISACGEIPKGAAESQVTVVGSQMSLSTCIWGKWTSVHDGGECRPPAPKPVSIWDEVLNIWAGLQKVEPSIDRWIEILRVWNAIKESAATGGGVVRVEADSEKSA